MPSSIMYEVKGSHVAHITINRPTVLNAVDHASIVELKEVLTEVRANPDIRVLVITGAGDKSFIAGADKEEISVTLRIPSWERRSRRYRAKPSTSSMVSENRLSAP